MEGKEGMTTREKILSKLRKNGEVLTQNTPGEYSMPEFNELTPTLYSNPLDKFIESARTVSGATVVELDKEGNINDLIVQIYPEAKIIASHLEKIHANINPQTVKDGKDLMKVDVGIIEGRFGVAENGCIWIPQTMKERAVCFASEYLIIILHKDAIVNNMHEAYEIIEKNPKDFEPYKFGTFISGASKTADIEGALVYGAQAARGVTIILV